ncbi:MAG TPA: P-loop NTPase [Thermoguttaceae bacterium]|nr:P-loop NTPase [Thermoguttaceae bacterium]
MQDQASRLRQWVRQYGSPKTGTDVRGPALVVVLGGRPGVGVTTVSANLAAALTAAGMRTVLLDGDPHSPDAARVCRLQTRETLADVITAGRTLPEVLQPGPGGIYVVPGVRPGQPLSADPRYASQRILEGLRGLGSCAEVVAADLGGQLSPWTRALWRAAHCRLAVMTADPAVLMDTYAVLKTLTAQTGLAPVHVVVNRAASEPEAKDVYDRLARTCLQFLALPVSLAGFVPADPRVEKAGWNQGLLVSWTPAPESASSIHQLAQYVAEILGKRLGEQPPPKESPQTGESEAPKGVVVRGIRPSAGAPWSETSAAPPQWHVHQPDWVGKLGFPVTVSPSLDSPVGENRKKD